MTATAPAVGPLAEALRNARKGRGLSIAELAVLAEVSPRLISELERGKRAHVSFDTAMRLVQLVGVTVTFDARTASADEAARRRVEQRRKHWTGEQSTLSMQAPPPASSDAAARLIAVANASRLVAGLQRAYRETTVTRRSAESAE